MSEDAIGFIGIGHMGFPMARNLLHAGYAVRAHDRDPAKSAALVRLERRAQQAFHPDEVVEPGGVVFSMVPDNQALQEIVEGEAGLLTHLGAGGIHVSMSTVSPSVSERLAERYAERGTQFVAATVSGRPDDAAAGRLAIFYAGPRAAKERVRPMLQALGNPQALTDLGERIAAANAIKLAVNFPLQPVITAMAAAACLAEQYGIPRADFFHLFLASPMFANGKVFHQYAALLEEGLNARGFDVLLGIKDVQLMQESAEAVGMQLPFVKEILGYLQQARDRGWGDKDWAIVGEIIRERAALPAE